MRRLLTLLLPAQLLACNDKSTVRPGPDADSGRSLPDVSQRLTPGQVRAGVVADGTALFGGSSAEGRVGDIKIYNARVQFIVQDRRPGSYYDDLGGGVIDADIVREPGEPGRDMIDELWFMMGLGRIVSPTQVEVVADGTDGQPAVVRVTGKAAPLSLITGTLEAPDFVDDHDVDVVTEYTLAPDAWLLRAETTIVWNGESTPAQAGDVSMVGMEVAETVLPGRGLEGGSRDSTGDWVGLIGRQNQSAIGIFSDDVPFSDGAIATVLEEVGPVIAGFGPITTFEPGSTHIIRRSIGVGPDLATLTGAWRADRGEPARTVGGQVLAGGIPVPGARVHIRDGDALETIAFTDADGRWSADVVAESPTAVATGRGHGEIVDLPSGAGWIAPYAHEVPAATALDSLAVGAQGAPFAEGYGISEPVPATADTRLTLTPPGTLRVSVRDGGPATVHVAFTDGDPVAADRALVPGRPGGPADGHVRDGDLDIPLEPGTYAVTVHRGLTHEPHEATVAVVAGEVVELSATLEPVAFPAGLLTADLHSHASPSGDGNIPMAHRLITQAANGVQVHFGTDHDHVADYRPLLAPLALTGWLTSVVADEVSPVLRGHTNVYPVAPDPTLPNNGAVRWWNGIENTDAFYQDIRTAIGPEAILQLNHPAGSSGMLGVADYDVRSGVVGRPSHFSERFDAMEVLNDGSYEAYMPFYMDLVARGYQPTPTGVSDAHGYRNGQGENITWLAAGIDSPMDLTDALLVETLRARKVVVSRGPYIDVTSQGAWAPGRTLTGAPTLRVDVTAASFVEVDTIDLHRDGVITESFPWEGTPIDIRLPTDADASYVLVARGSTPMAPVYADRTPWAMAPAIRVDTDGDGWDAPLPPLVLGN
ncbi:MAG: CehA/McbA family metallohydrolase [Myxococcota bacterium]|nr:CehA/McbA family metallohydrolase [Myxococcota bacterium]